MTGPEVTAAERRVADTVLELIRALDVLRLAATYDIATVHDKERKNAAERAFDDARFDRFTERVLAGLQEEVTT